MNSEDQISYINELKLASSVDGQKKINTLLFQHKDIFDVLVTLADELKESVCSPMDLDLESIAKSAEIIVENFDEWLRLGVPVEWNSELMAEVFRLAAKKISLSSGFDEKSFNSELEDGWRLIVEGLAVTAFIN